MYNKKKNTLGKELKKKVSVCFASLHSNVSHYTTITLYGTTV